jgi:hypothetical protein
MTNIPFTQFLRPNGKRREVLIDRPDEIAAKAQAIMEAGFRFEIEELTNGYVNMTVSDDNSDYARELCPNGPRVPRTVDALIEAFDIDAAVIDREATMTGFLEDDGRDK